MLLQSKTPCFGSFCICICRNFTSISNITPLAQQSIVCYWIVAWESYSKRNLHNGCRERAFKNNFKSNVFINIKCLYNLICTLPRSLKDTNLKLHANIKLFLGGGGGERIGVDPHPSVHLAFCMFTITYI